MRINSIGPSFKGDGDVVIRYKDGKNAKNPYVNNIFSKVIEDLRKEHVSATIHQSNHEINIISAPKRMIEALAKTDLVCKIRVGDKLRLIV